MMRKLASFLGIFFVSFALVQTSRGELSSNENQTNLLKSLYSWARHNAHPRRLDSLIGFINHSSTVPEKLKIVAIIKDAPMSGTAKFAWIEWISNYHLQPFFTWIIPWEILTLPINNDANKTWLSSIEENALRSFFQNMARWEFPSLRRSHLAFGDILLLFARYEYSSTALSGLFSVFETTSPHNDIIEGDALVWTLSVGPDRLNERFIAVIEVLLRMGSEGNGVDELRLRTGFFPSVVRAQRNCPSFHTRGSRSFDFSFCGPPLVSEFMTISLSLVMDILSDGVRQSDHQPYSDDRPFYEYNGSHPTGLLVEEIARFRSINSDTNQ